MGETPSPLKNRKKDKAPRSSKKLGKIDEENSPRQEEVDEPSAEPVVDAEITEAER